MTAQEYLSQPKALKRRIRADQRKIEYWQEKSYSVSGMQYDGMPHNPNCPSDAPFVKCLEKVFELKSAVESRKKKLAALQEEICERIALLISPEERLVLCMYYLDGCSFSEIGELMDMTEREVLRIHGKALQHFPVPEEAAVQECNA